MKPTHRVNLFRFLPLFLGGTFLIGCTSSSRPAESGIDPAGADAPAAVDSAPERHVATDAEADADPDAVDELGRRIDQFAQSVQPGLATPSSPEQDGAVDLPGDPSAESPPSMTEPGRAAGEGMSEVAPLEATAAVRKGLPDPVVPALPSLDKAVGEANAENRPQPPEPLRSRLERRLQDEPGALARIFDYQLLELIEEPVTKGESVRLASGEGGFAGDLASHDLHSEDEVILETVARGLADFRTTLTGITPGNRPLPSEKIAPLLAMVRQLERQAGLELPTIVLCERVDKFGSYRPLPREFGLGKAKKVLLYVEVDRFGSERREDQLWETRLSVRAVLYDPAGKEVVRVREAEAVDRSRQQRRDFFVCLPLAFPAIEEAGRYTLKVTVHDRISNRIAQQSLPVTFGEAPAR